MTVLRSLRAGAAGLVLAGLLAAPALAAQTVQLRPDIAVRGGMVTLGDLFEGAGGVGSVVVASGSGSSVVLDAGRLQATALANGLVWENAQGMRRVIARADTPSGNGGSSIVRAGAPAERSAKVLAYARDINAGELVQAQDLVWSPTLAFAPADAPRDSGAVIGMAAKRPLRAGAAVSSRDLGVQPVIKKDDVIAVAYESDGVKLVLQGRALTSAGPGETVNVLNPSSKKIVQAVARGPGEAVVGPEADRLKSLLRTDPQFLASLR